MTNKILMHNLKELRLNMKPEEFMNSVLEAGSFFRWMKEDLEKGEIEKNIISDIKEIISSNNIFITMPSDHRLRRMNMRHIKSYFDMNAVVQKIRYYYEKTK